MSISSVLSIIQKIEFQFSNFVLNNVLNCPKIFTNLISASSLHQNVFDLYDRRQTAKKIQDDLEISAARKKNVCIY